MMNKVVTCRESRMAYIRGWTAFVILVTFSILSSTTAKYFDCGSCNYGVSFGFFSGVSDIWWYVVMSFILVALCGLLIFVSVSAYMRWGVYILLAGGVSNLVVRLIFGCVWDWINLRGLRFSFNTADILIDVGIVVVLLGLMSNLRDNG